ncbi:TPA: polysaccharide lyase family 7 protein [Pseudomonas aeruginosa]
MPDLSTWNLTIPQGRPAITISTSQLQRDYRSDYFQRTADGIRFWVPVNGSHTRNSEFPRSELRETLSSGRPYNWRYARADNWLEATLRIEAVPSTRRMIIGQIHSDGSNSGQAAPLVKLLYQLRLDQGRVQALVRERPEDGGTRAYTLMDGIPLGQSFSYRIGVSRSGLLSVSVNGSALEQQLDPQWVYQGLYFKAGLYLQDNRGPSSEGGRATFSELRVSHQ